MKELTTTTPSAPKLKLPPIKTLDDISVAGEVVLRAVASNKCSPDKGSALMSMLEQMRKNFENRDLAAKVEELERLLKAA
jgi:hypothetical protein